MATTNKTDIQKLRGGESRPTSVSALLQRSKDQIEAALPRHMSPDRMLRIALTSIRRNEKLQQADPISLVGAIIECAQWGLEPGITAHLVPFYNSRKNRLEVQYIADYRGLIALARRNGQIGRFDAEVVYEGDTFKYEKGTSQYLTHVPLETSQQRRLTHAWALAEAKDKSWVQFEVMPKDQIDKVRKASRAGDKGPWVDWYEEMAKKTVIRRLCKLLDQTPELQAVLDAENRFDAGISQNTGLVLEGEGFSMEPELEETKPALAPSSPPSDAGAQEKEAPSSSQTTTKKTTKARGRPRKKKATDAEIDAAIPDMPPPAPPDDDLSGPAWEDTPSPPPRRPSSGMKYDSFMRLLKEAEQDDEHYLRALIPSLEPEFRDQAQVAADRKFGG